jgi:hypothetical protein
VILAQPTDHVLRYFGKDGAPIATIGKEGESEGDFSGIVQVGWMGDTLWVNDNRLKRLTLVSPQRKVLRVIPLTFDLLFPSGEPMPMPTVSLGVMSPGPAIAGVYADHEYLLTAPVGTNAVVPAEWHKPAQSGAAYVRFAVNGVAQSLVAWIPPQAKCANLPQICPRLLSAIAPNGSTVAFATSTTSGADSGITVVSVLGVKGDTIFSRRYPFAGVPVPRAYGDSIIAAMTRQRANVTLPPGMTAPPLPTFQPTIMPPVTSLVVGRDGTIWIGQATTEGSKPWLLLDARGNPIGTVALPANVTIRAAERGTIWATERTDVTGVENVVRYSVAYR